jgi:hypothetical protein
MEVRGQRSSRSERRGNRGRAAEPSVEEASIVAKAMVDALTDILRSERS